MNHSKPLKKIALLTILILISLISCQSLQDVKIVDLTVEYCSSPTGVDIPRPRFSWKIKTEKRAVLQQACQLIVGESLTGIKKGTGKLWNSGRIFGNSTVNLEYSGAPLQSDKEYYWQVGVWLNDGRYILSQPAFFHTGILDIQDWKAEWITTEEEIIHTSPLLRKEFQVDKKIRKAYAFVSACGFYEFYLNGCKVGDHVLDPAITDCRKTILYSTYDVTDLLKRGSNVAGAMLGNGAWNLRKTEGRWSWGSGGVSLGNPCFLMQLMITFQDGSRSVVVTDTTWKTAQGPVTFNNLYGGEDYDPHNEISGWSEVGFDDREWVSVRVTDGPGGILKSQLVPALKVTHTIRPVRETNPSPGVYLFDLGQNIAGWWRVQVKGSPGQVIRIRGAETLNDSLFPKSLEEGDKLSTKFLYHSRTWTDYILMGNQTEIYEPRFFYTGFRYIEITTSDGKNPELLKAEGKVVRSALEFNGIFYSSDSLLNRIHRAGLWSQMGNAHGYPTDCPHREKGAYNGDGQVIAETSIHDFHMAPFYTKWLSDMRDAQEENGRIPNTSPTLVGGMGGGVAWGSAYILIPWWMHHYYHDTRILEEHYPAMKKYLQYLKILGSRDEDPGEPYIIDNFDGYWYSLGEWCAPERRDCPNHPVVNTFYYYNNSRLLSKIAGLLGYTEDSVYLSALSDTIKQEFNRKFFDPTTALYGTGETFQTYQLLALTGDLVPEGKREDVFKTIVDDLHKRNEHLNTGIIGTKYLWPVLVQGGEADLAFRVATQNTYPGYGFWINNGSTTLLEEWSGEHSHNHQMFGSVSEYFYKYLAGIQSPMEGKTGKGYNTIHIHPYLPEKLDFVNASVETVAGTVASAWNKEGNSIIQQVTIPANTTATVIIPTIDPKNTNVFEGNAKIWEDNRFMPGVEGISEVKKEAHGLAISIGSGKYVFRTEKNNQ